MRTKEEILEWVREAKSSSSYDFAIVEILADIRDLFYKKSDE